MIQQSVTESGLVADLFHDGTAEPRRAIIMLGGSEGGRMWSRPKRLLNALVNRGYSVLSLAYFKERGLPDSLEEIPLEYFETAFAWLAQQPTIMPERYGLIGGSKGAEAALLLASRYSQVEVVVALTPSSVVWSGIPKNRFDLSKHRKSSWSYQGEGLPFLAVEFSRSDWWSLLTLRLRKKGEEALRNEANVEEATIPVEDCRCAILLLSGRRDQVWPTMMMCDQIMRRLNEAKYPHPYEHVAYNTGHIGLVRNKDGWRKALTFLDTHFEARPAAVRVRG